MYLHDVLSMLRPGMHLCVWAETIWPGSKAVAIVYNGVFVALTKKHTQPAFPKRAKSRLIASHIRCMVSRTLGRRWMLWCSVMPRAHAMRITRCGGTRKHILSSIQSQVLPLILIRHLCVCFLHRRGYLCRNFPLLQSNRSD